MFTQKCWKMSYLTNIFFQNGKINGPTFERPNVCISLMVSVMIQVGWWWLLLFSFLFLVVVAAIPKIHDSHSTTLVRDLLTNDM